MKNGTFIISLDFELYWGVRDSRSLEEYGENILGVRQAIPALLDLFEQYNIKATFATVGFLFCSGKEELMQSLPVTLPSYKNSLLSPYIGYFNALGKSEAEDQYHFAPSLINMIMQKKQHEIATHTFSHYYCLEAGQTTEQFNDDLLAAKKIANRFDVEFKSIVFPRNQYNEDYLDVCRNVNLSAFRGNEDSWLYVPRNRSDESLVRRVWRLMDSYINISGNHLHSPNAVNGLCNLPSSRFLRPYKNNLARLDWLKLRRIKKQMNAAADHKKLFHLWFHPHNFGKNLKKNLLFLEKILIHYQYLREAKGFTCMTMSEAASDYFSSN